MFNHGLPGDCQPITIYIPRKKKAVGVRLLQKKKIDSNLDLKHESEEVYEI